MLRKRREMADFESHITPLIDTLLLVDRNIDLITPLLSQLIYEGLIDEIFNIENSKYFKNTKVLIFLLNLLKFDSMCW